MLIMIQALQKKKKKKFLWLSFSSLNTQLSLAEQKDMAVIQIPLNNLWVPEIILIVKNIWLAFFTSGVLDQ